MAQQGGQQNVTPEMQAVAQELHRKRIAAGNGVAPDFRTAVAEVAFLTAYEIAPTVDDLKVGKRSLQFIVDDDDGNQVRVIQQQRWPMRVWSSRLDVDAYVFTTTVDQTVNIAGWLPAGLVEEAPIHWQEEDGERTDFAFEIGVEALIEMPTDFKFTDRCQHGDEYGAIWSYTNEAWECCGCGRYLYSRADNERIKHQDERFRRPSGSSPED